MNRAFVGLGSNADRPRERLEQALVRMEAEGLRVAAVATPVSGPYVGPDGRPAPGAPDVLNTVAEIGTTLTPEELLACLLRIETDAGRVRGAGPVRALDLDLLTFGVETRATADLTLPHPRAMERAFVLGPWAEIAPETMTLRDASLRNRDPAAYAALRREPALALPDIGARAEVLHTRFELRDWRRSQGASAFVPTMGALHAGHASLVRRARARDGTPVLATVFVNPLQFGPQEDLARYPRTLEADLALLRSAGADVVYVPEPKDLYPAGFATYVVPEGPALGFEGELRPGHFRGVTTVVLKLLLRALPLRAWFGQKDAQQVAVLRRMVRDLDVPVDLQIGATVRDEDGLALSSRNRYLSADERARALAFPAALEDVAHRAARGERDAEALLGPARARLSAAGLEVDYLALVDPLDFTPRQRTTVGDHPSLIVGAVRAGTTRLLDNRWVVVP